VDGVLIKNDAIEIARKALGEPADVVDATLVKNEAGFLDWWITFQLTSISGKEGKEVKRAFLVNPYLGAVRKRVEPFEQKKASEEKKVIPPFKRLRPVESTVQPLPEAKPPAPQTPPRKPVSPKK
jgi:hypothetical protein